MCLLYELDTSYLGLGHFRNTLDNYILLWKVLLLSASDPCFPPKIKKKEKKRKGISAFVHLLLFLAFCLEANEITCILIESNMMWWMEFMIHVPNFKHVFVLYILWK